MDVNGKEMNDLFRFIKRGAPLFDTQMGKANRLKEHYCKFLLTRYGVMYKTYSGQTEMAVIEGDIKKLIAEEFIQAQYEELLNPPDNFS